MQRPTQWKWSKPKCRQCGSSLIVWLLEVQIQRILIDWRQMLFCWEALHWHCLVCRRWLLVRYDYKHSKVVFTAGVKSWECKQSSDGLCVLVRFLHFPSPGYYKELKYIIKILPRHTYHLRSLWKRRMISHQCWPIHYSLALLHWYSYYSQSPASYKDETDYL